MPFQIIHSSILSGVNHRMTFVRNAVDGIRREVKMAVDGKNNGGSQITELSSSTKKEDIVHTVLLSDVFKVASLKSKPKNVVIKADIETYECQTFLNSQQGKQSHNELKYQMPFVCFNDPSDSF